MKREKREQSREIKIDDVLDTGWFIRLVKSATRDYEIPLTHRALKIIKKELRRGLEYPVFDILAQTKPFRSVRAMHPGYRKRVGMLNARTRSPSD